MDEKSNDVEAKKHASTSPDTAVDNAKSNTSSNTDPAKALPNLTKSTTTQSAPAYSSFTRNQKRAIIAAGSFAAFFSPMTGSIYFPALTTISDSLHVSSSQINLTVTTYLIWQGIAPMMIAGFSDNVGRRPAYILCFTIYIIANLALSLQNSYTALLVLRMLQSAGSSGTVALANGMVADLVTSAERGEYIAFASLGTMLGPSISPVIGGLIAQNLDWHWIFWFLLILACSTAIPFLLFLPETGRKVVGDGSICPPWPNMNITDYIREKHRRERNKGLSDDEKAAQEKMIAELRKNYKFTFPNPLPTFKILYDAESSAILVVTGLALACFYALSTGASESFKKTYGFNDIQVALMFIPIGAGGIISAFTTGKIVDWNFRRWCRKVGVEADKKRRQDLSNFPIERARMEIGLPFFFIGLAATMAYGWMLSYKVNLAGPVIIMLLFGWALIAASQALNALMVDIWPGMAAAATAANNLVRCLLGAGASAAIDPMSKAMGRGPAYTVLASLSLASTPLMIWIMVKGIKLRKRRAQRERVRKERKEEKRRQKNGEVKEKDTGA